MTRINIINCVSFLFIQLCILSIVKAYHETVHIKIKNGDEIIELNWKRTKQYLANKNLPIWGTWKNKLISMPNLMNRVGDFVTYHDVEKSSAVVYYTKLDFFYGIVDTRFIITQLPLKDIGQVPYFEVGGPYVNARAEPESEQYFHDNQDTLFLKSLTDNEINYVNSLIESIITSTLPSEPSSSQTHEYQRNYDVISTSDHVNYDKPSTSNQIEPLPRPNVNKESCRPSSTILHPEILVFISYDIITNFIKFHSMEGVIQAVVYYITYFNAIDMLFAKLATNNIEIHINIAGLMIEFEQGVFPYEFSQIRDHTFQNIPHLDALQTIYDSLPSYIKKNKDVFLKDSYDFLFLATYHPIEKDGMPIKGYSRSPFNVYKQRKYSKSYQVSLGLVIQQKDAFRDYIIATRLIANLMSIEYDPSSESSLHNNKQCNTIMQLHNNHCRNCLVWSEKSQQELKQYVRSNSNHCFLLNYPRSLYPHNSRIGSLSPEVQCSCYGFNIEHLDPMYMISIPMNSCGQPLKCSRVKKSGAYGIIPLDGTPCGDFNKVCWNKICLPIIEGSNVDDCKESCPPKRQKITHKDVQ